MLHSQLSIIFVLATGAIAPVIGLPLPLGKGHENSGTVNPLQWVLVLVQWSLLTLPLSTTQSWFKECEYVRMCSMGPSQLLMISNSGIRIKTPGPRILIMVSPHNIQIRILRTSWILLVNPHQLSWILMVHPYQIRICEYYSIFNLNDPWRIFMISLARLDIRIIRIPRIFIRVMVNPHLCKNMSNDHRLSRTLMFHCLGNRVPSIRGYLRISSSSCE